MNFRAEAIQAIGNIVRAREWCKKNHVGLPLPARITDPVINQYNAYKKKWSLIGVARFLIKYEINLRNMATGEYKQQQLISKLILEAYHYGRISQTSNKPYKRSSVSGQAVHCSFAK